MRNRTIRMKRLREQRLLDEFMRTPRRLIMGAQPTLTEWASGPGRIWTMPNA
jgi:hypothetical protein